MTRARWDSSDIRRDGESPGSICNLSEGVEEAGRAFREALGGRIGPGAFLIGSEGRGRIRRVLEEVGGTRKAFREVPRGGMGLGVFVERFGGVARASEGFEGCWRGCEGRGDFSRGSDGWGGPGSIFKRF